MLKHLFIKNFVLIDEIQVDFHKGFSVVTGETGAGKSIFLGALSLLLGNRASGNIPKDDTKKTIIEAIFQLSSTLLKTIFESEDLDFSTETIIRREFLPNGKTRAFVNDSPVNVNVLKTIGQHLIDIHSQHQNQWLNDNEFQLSVVDSFAGTTPLLTKYQTLLTEYQNTNKQLTEITSKYNQLEQEKDYLQFQYHQLVDANLTLNEQEEIEDKVKVLQHFEEITQLLKQIETTFYDSDDNILSKVENTSFDLNKISEIFSSAESWAQRMESVSIELADLIREISSAASNLSYEPEKLEKLKERLDLLISLQQKHHVNSVEELIKIKDALETRLDTIENSNETILELQKQSDKLHQELIELAKQLSSKRKNTFPQIIKKVNELIVLLGMKHGEFKIDLEHNTENLRILGCDTVTFLFKANKEGIPQPINQVASGGELSRLMLAIKSLLASKQSLPTIIFDEIDTGISGSIADKMGHIMKEMAKEVQLITITHLPQIAALGKHHYNVTKTETNNHTFISVKYLNQQERINEIATLLSAEKITTSSLKNAEELLNR